MRMRNALLPALLIGTAALAAACAKKEPFRAVTTTESGLTVVRNPGRPLHRNASLTLSEEIAFNGRDGGEAPLNAVDSFAVDVDGSVVLCDAGLGLIKSYSAQGAFLGSFRPAGDDGQAIDGPRIVGLTDAGELAVEGGGHRLLAYFDRGGRLLRTTSLAGFNIFRLAVNVKGRILMHHYRYVRPNVLYYLRLYDPALKELWSYGQSWEPQSVGNDFYAYLPILWWTTDAAGGVVYGYPDRYELKVFDAGGSPVRIIRREGRPPALSEEEKDAYRREYAKAPYVRLHFPEAHSAFQKFTVDERGWIYVMTWAKASAGPGYVYDVFDDKGVYTARIDLARMPQLWKGGRVYTLERHASGSVVLSRNRYALDLR